MSAARFRLPTFGLFVSLLFAPVAGPVASASEIPVGSGSFVFLDRQGNADRPITVHTYRPESYRSGSPIVFVMHGVLRNGKDYRDQWIDEAKKRGFLLLVPEFSQKSYPGGDWYNLGHVFDSRGKPVVPPKWTFSALEHLFDHVREIVGSSNPTYYLYGHSAGGWARRTSMRTIRT